MDEKFNGTLMGKQRLGYKILMFYCYIKMFIPSIQCIISIPVCSQIPHILIIHIYHVQLCWALHNFQLLDMLRPKSALCNLDLSVLQGTYNLKKKLCFSDS